MKVVKKIIPPLLIIILLVVYFNYEKAKTTPDPTKIITSGYIEAHTVQIGSLNGGRILGLDVKDGDKLEAGQIVAELEKDRLEFKKKEIEASIDTARAMYDKLVNGPRAEETGAALEAFLAAQARVRKYEEGYRDTDIAPLVSQLKGAESTLEKAKADYERMENLFNSDVISQEELDSARVGFDIAHSKVESIQDEIARMEAGFTSEDITAAKHEAGALRENLLALESGSREEDLRAAGSEIERLQASLEGIEDEIDEATVRSPVDGTIREVTVRAGDIVQPSAPIAVLVEDTNLWVQVYVPAYRLPSIVVGQKAIIKPDSLSGESVDATISYISPEGEFTPRNIQTEDERVQRVFAIRLTIDSQDERLKPGMGCEVEIPLGR